MTTKPMRANTPIPTAIRSTGRKVLAAAVLVGALLSPVEANAPEGYVIVYGCDLSAEMSTVNHRNEVNYYHCKTNDSDIGIMMFANTPGDLRLKELGTGKFDIIIRPVGGQ